MTAVGGYPLVRGLDHWREALCRSFIELECEQLGNGPFSGAVVARDVGPLVVSEVTSAPHRVTRSRQAIARGSEDHFYLGVPLTAGARLEQNEREAELRPGDLVLYDSARPYTLSLTQPLRMAVWHIPRSFLLDRSPAIESRTGFRVSGAFGVGAAVSGFLALVAGRASELSAAEAAALAASLGDLLVAALGSTVAAGTSAVGAAHLERAKSFIDTNLDRPALRPADVAAAVGYSVRQLHRLFAREGTTVARYILQRRLAVCARELARPQAAHKGVTQIAFDAGFTDGAHFSRAFRRQYGAAPRDYRAAARGGRAGG
jgi:AraC-like DNA-binding protein